MFSLYITISKIEFIRLSFLRRSVICLSFSPNASEKANGFRCTYISNIVSILTNGKFTHVQDDRSLDSDRLRNTEYAVYHMVSPDNNASRASERVKKKEKEGECGVVALCMSDSKSTFVRLSAHPSVHPSVSALKDAPLRGSVTRRGVNHGPIFFFLVDFVCGRERLPAPERHSLPFLAFLSLTSQVFLFPVPPVSALLHFPSSFVAPAVFFLFPSKRGIPLAFVKFYDPPRYIYVLSKWERIYITGNACDNGL